VTKDTASGRAALTRRAIVRAAIAVGASATFVRGSRPAAAAPTISKAAVAYQDQPQGGRECDKCLQFVSPDGCKIVEGTISPHGSCRIFQPLSQSS
jgi:hypothetical protein